MSERRAPARVGEGLLGLEAQAIARHHPHHALHRAIGDQGGGGDDGQQALAAAGRHGGEDVAQAIELIPGYGLHEPGDLGLVGAERAVAGWSTHARTMRRRCRDVNPPRVGPGTEALEPPDRQQTDGSLTDDTTRGCADQARWATEKAERMSQGES